MKDLVPFKEVLLQADPSATKFKGVGGDSYTVWTPYSPDRAMADDQQDDFTWRIQVDRFTKKDNDPIVQAIYDALSQAGISFEYDLDFEEDTGYIHHIFSCVY